MSISTFRDELLANSLKRGSPNQGFGVNWVSDQIGENK